jgi:hypothetical protein
MDPIPDIVYIHPVVSTIVAALIWIGFRIFWVHKIDRKYGITLSGGRCGVITVSIDQNLARAEYEVGSTIDLIIDQSSLMTVDRQPLSEQRHAELVETLRAWAKDRGTTLEIVINY